MASTMKGVLIEKTGGVEVLQYKTNLPIPTPKEGQVLIKNEFIGINYIDTYVTRCSELQHTSCIFMTDETTSYFRSGLYPAPKPEILGREAEGTVVGVSSSGNNYGIKENDRVVYMATGSYAEYTCAPAAKVHKVPSGIKPSIAAASLLQGLTALTLIREAYAVQKGDWILVHAAAGGVGLWLCQLLRAVGAKVIGTASTPEKIELAQKNGGQYMINYSHENVVEKVKELTNGDGVAAVFDGVGKSTFDMDLELLALKGSLVSFGNASGAVPPFAIAKLSAKNLKLLRPTLFNYIHTREEFERFTGELFEMISKNDIDVRIHKVYDLKDVAQAHTDLEGRKTTGKLVMKP